MSNQSYDRYALWKGWRDAEFGFCDLEKAVYYSCELRRYGCPDLRGLSVLEIGFGNGDFAAWATTQGANYVGTEIIPELILRGRNSGFDVHNSSERLDSFLGPCSVDTVVAFDVFEHIALDDLSNLLQGLKAFIREDGLIIARIPSGDSPFSRAIQHGDLTHKTVLGSSAVRQLAKETGYEIVSIQESVLPICGLGLRRGLRRVSVATVRRLSYGIVRILMGGGQLVLSPNLVFVWRKKPLMDE